jgi:D-amino-acid dehydrogenase
MELSGYEETVNRARLDALRAGAARYLRRPEGDCPEEWCGWRPMTPDELPILGGVPGLANAFLSTGHGMMGVSMAPATARLVADLVTGAEPFVDPKPYSITRFG